MSPDEWATAGNAGDANAGGRTTFSLRMTQLMQERGYTFGRLAAAVHVHRSHVHRFATGARPAPHEELARAIGVELGAADELVDLARREHAPPSRSTPMGDADAANVRATLQSLVTLDTLHGSTGLSPLAVRSFRTAADRLAVVGGSPDVRAAVADLGAAAAWITADDTQRDQSRTLALEALALADLAGDRRLHRFLMSHLSMVSEHGGRYADALAYADRLVAEEHDNPRVEAMVQVRRARALSGLGAHADALDAWDHAAQLLTSTPSEEDGLTYWIHDAEMALHRAVILTRGGDRSAVEWGQRAVEWLPAGQGRDQVLFRAMLLHDAVVAHAWRDVPPIVEQLLRLAGAAGSARVPEELGRAWRLIQGQRAPAMVRDAVKAAYDAYHVA